MGQIIVFLLGCLAVSAWSAESGLSAAAHLTEQLSQLKQMEARFTQIVADAKGRILQEVQGAMAVERPRQFYWSTQQPYQQTIVANGQRFWIVDYDLEQVTVQPLDQRVGNTPALLLSEEPAQIARSFTVTFRPLPDPTLKRFTLTPKAEERLFETMTVTFRQNVLIEMDLQDHLGQRTAINFNQVKLNQTIAPGLFTVSIPAGFDVIDETP